ncbi:MAG: TlpA family protein disulfide reductase [Deltaproteobacteria bacterium]|nr:TlpA family protein disulfide reductase [Deltaproteobacteria bacterium]
MGFLGIGSRFGLACVVSLAVASSIGCGGGKPDVKAPTGEAGGKNDGPAEVGKPAPDLSITTVNGKGSVSMESLKGKVAVIDFWATWCGPCKQSFPKLEELAKKFSGKVEIVGVSVDDSKDGVAEFAKEHGATFPIGWDDGHTIANRWKVGTMPTTYVVDSTGTVRFIHDGYHDGEADKISKELAELSDEPGGGSTKSKVADSGEKPPAGDTPPAGDKPAGDKPAGDSASGDAADPPPEKPAGKKPGKGKPAGKKPAGGGGKPKPGGKKK